MQRNVYAKEKITLALTCEVRFNKEASPQLFSLHASRNSYRYNNNFFERYTLTTLNFSQ